MSDELGELGVDAGGSGRVATVIRGQEGSAGGGESVAAAPDRPGVRRWAQLVACVVPVVVVVGMAWQWRWMSDDGFIHLRVVQQVVHGNGPVFNVGERVEASTSPLWVGLLTLSHPVTSLALPWKAVLLGIALTGLGMAAAQRAAVQLARAAGHSGLVLPVGAMAVAALPPFWEFATSGLETGLAFGWLGLSSWWCTHRAIATETADEGASGDAGTKPGTDVAEAAGENTSGDAGREGTSGGVVWWAEVAGAAVVGLGWLIRPDLAVFTVTFGAVVLAAAWSGGWRRRAVVGAAMAALPAIYQVFRMGYYGMVVPNTALAKEAGTAQWGQGWRYLVDLVGPYWLWVPLGVLLAVLVRQVAGDLGTGARLRAGARLAPAVGAAVHALYVVRFGGDFMHARLLLPAVFGLAAPVGLPLSPVRGEGGVRRTFFAAKRLLSNRSGSNNVHPGDGVLRAGVGALVLGWAVVCGLWLRPGLWNTDTPMGVALPVSEDGFIEEERELVRVLTGMRHPVRQDLQATTLDPSGGWYAPGVATVVDIDQLPQLTPIRLPLRQGLGADAAFPASAIGVISYRLGPDVHTIDLQGLAHPVGSHLDHLQPRYKPGHQKPVPLVWTVVGVSDVTQVRSPDGEVLARAAELDPARAALDCGQLRDYLRGIQQPLTLGRFLGNVIDSVPNTLLRLSPDPEEAERQMCGAAN